MKITKQTYPALKPAFAMSATAGVSVRPWAGAFMAEHGLNKAAAARGTGLRAWSPPSR